MYIVITKATNNKKNQSKIYNKNIIDKLTCITNIQITLKEAKSGNYC